MAHNERQTTDGLVDAMPDQLEALANKLLAAVRDFRAHHTPGSRDLPHRAKIIDVARAVQGVATLPDEQVMDPSINISRVTATRMLIAWDAFAHIPAEGSISYAELAEKTGVAQSLLTRFAWMLVATGLLTQTGPDRVGHTTKSLVFASHNPTRALYMVM